MQPVLRASSILGYRPLPRGLGYLGDEELLYPSGARSLTRFEAESRMQSQVLASAECSAITALAVSPDSRCAAWAEFTHDGRALVVVCDLEAAARAATAALGSSGGAPSPTAAATAAGASGVGFGGAGGPAAPKGRRTRRLITAFESAPYLPITCLAFTSDSKHLLLPSAAPDVTLHYIAWDSGVGGRLVASARAVTGLGGCNPHPILQADSNPLNPHHFAVTGHGTLRHYRWAEGNNADTLQPSNLDVRSEASAPFTCHAWLEDERMVVGTATGELLLFEGTSLRKRIAPPREGPMPGPTFCATLLPFPGGFLLGGDGGLLRVYEHSDHPGALYELAHTFAPGGCPPGAAGRVCALAASHSLEEAAVGCANGALFHFPLGSYDMAKKAALAAARAAGADIAPTFPALLPHFVTPMHTYWATPAAEHSSSSASSSSAASSALMPPALLGTHFSPLATPPLLALSSRPPPPTGTLTVTGALHRPLLASITSDRHVRLWNATGAAALSLEARAGGDEDGEGPGGGGGGSGGGASPGASPAPSSGSDAGEEAAGGPGRPSVLPGTVPACEQVLDLAPFGGSTLLSASLHPLGDTLLVSSDAAVLLFSVRLGGLALLKELPLRAVTVLSYSASGGLWAAAGLGGSISLFSTYTGLLLGQLKGGHKEAVTALAWGPEDRTLASVSRDGAVCLWGVVVANAVAGGAVPSASRAALQGCAAVAADSLRAEGTERTPPTALSCKLVSRVENGDIAPTALCFGGVEGEVLLAGIVKEGGGGGGGRAKVKFSAAAEGGGGGAAPAAAPKAPPITGPVLVALQMLVLADGGGAEEAATAAAAAAAAGASGATATGASGLSSPNSKGATGAGASPKGTGKSRRNSTLAPPSLPPPIPQRAPPRLLIPIHSRAPIHAMHTLVIDAHSVPGMPYPVAVLVCGMGHRVADGTDLDLRGRATLAAAAAASPATASASELAHALAGKLLSAADPVGGLRIYRLPLLSPATSGVPFAPAPSAADAPRPVHPYGYFDKGSSGAHSGPVTALHCLPGERGQLVSSSADGSLVTWQLSPTALWAQMEASGVRVQGLGSGSGSGEAAGEEAGGSTALTPSLAAEAVNGFARVSPGAPLGGCSARAGWLPWAETYGLSASHLEKIVAERQELALRLSDLNSSNRHAERLRESELALEMGAAEERYMEELLAAREALEAARANKAEVEARGEEMRQALVAQESAEEAGMKALHAGKLAAEEARLERKSLEKAAYAHRVEEEERLLAAERESALRALAAEHAEALEALREQCEEVEAAAVALVAVGAAKEALLEGSLDSELEGTRARLQLRVAEEARVAGVLKGENGVLKRHFGGVLAATEEVQAALEVCRGGENKLEGALKSLEKDYAAIVKDLRERDAMLEDKDSRILSIKLKTQELEKFKFVLNYKIQELKRAVMPRKRDIANLRATLSEMEVELLQLHKSSSLLGIMVEELKLKRRGLLRSQRAAAAQEGADSERLANIQRDMQSLNEQRLEAARLLKAAGVGKGGGGGAGATGATATGTSSPTKSVVTAPGSSTFDVGAAMAASAAAASLRTVLVALYQKYILGEVSAVRGDAALPAVDAATGALVFPVGVAPDEVAEEVAASRAFLESAVGALRLKIEADSKLQAQGAVRLTAENAQLLGEVNDLRRGLRYSWGELVKAKEGASGISSSSASSSSSSSHGGLSKEEERVLQEAMGGGGEELTLRGGGGGGREEEATGSLLATTAAAAAAAAASATLTSTRSSAPLLRASGAATFTAAGASGGFARRTTALLGVVGKGGAVAAAPLAATATRGSIPSSPLRR